MSANPILDSASPESKLPTLDPLPEFIQGSFGGVTTHAPPPDIDSLAHRFHTTASVDMFNDEDNTWKQERGNKWSFQEL